MACYESGRDGSMQHTPRVNRRQLQKMLSQNNFLLTVPRCPARMHNYFTMNLFLGKQSNFTLLLRTGDLVSALSRSWLLGNWNMHSSIKKPPAVPVFRDRSERVISSPTHYLRTDINKKRVRGKLSIHLFIIIPSCSSIFQWYINKINTKNCRTVEHDFL